MLMISLTTFTSSQTSPLLCQQLNLPSTKPRSTPLPLTPGNCLTCSLLSLPLPPSLPPIPSSLTADDFVTYFTTTSCHSPPPSSTPPSFQVLFQRNVMTARVKPLLKKPTLDTADIRNFRPVSLLSLLFKTLEHAISNQLSSYPSPNNLLDPHQSGFKTHSTLH